MLPWTISASLSHTLSCILSSRVGSILVYKDCRMLGGKGVQGHAVGAASLPFSQCFSEGIRGQRETLHPVPPEQNAGPC